MSWVNRDSKNARFLGTAVLEDGDTLLVTHRSVSLLLLWLLLYCRNTVCFNMFCSGEAPESQNKVC